MRYRLRTLLILLALLPPVLAVIGPPLVRWMTPKPLPASLPAPLPAVTPAPPVYASYAMGSADPQLVYSAVTTQLAGTPNVRMSLDTQSRSLAVLAPPAVQVTVQATIIALQGTAAPAPSVNFQLKRGEFPVRPRVRDPAEI